MCFDVLLGFTFLMIVEIIWMQRFILASLLDTLKSQNPIDCLILSNDKLLLDEMYSLMRIILELCS
jgi:hypothetical protein